MVLKGVNWVHNDKIRSNGLERSLLGTQWKTYRGYLLRQVVFHFTEKSMDFSVWCCPVEGWVGNVVFAVSELKSAWKLQFSPKTTVFGPKSMFFIKIHVFHQNLWFSKKTAVFIIIHSFHQNLQFSSKSVIFIKIRGFWHFSLSFQEDNIRILCEMKDHLPRKVAPIIGTLAFTTLLSVAMFCLLTYLR